MTGAVSKNSIFQNLFQVFSSGAIPFPSFFIDYSGQYKYVAEIRILEFEKLRIFYATLKYAKITAEIVSSASS